MGTIPGVDDRTLDAAAFSMLGQPWASTENMAERTAE
jgi:hypothetical protein